MNSNELYRQIKEIFDNIEASSNVYDSTSSTYDDLKFEELKDLQNKLIESLGGSKDLVDLTSFQEKYGDVPRIIQKGKATKVKGTFTPNFNNKLKNRVKNFFNRRKVNKAARNYTAEALKLESEFDHETTIKNQKAFIDEVGLGLKLKDTLKNYDSLSNDKKEKIDDFISNVGGHGEKSSTSRLGKLLSEIMDGEYDKNLSRMFVQDALINHVKNENGEHYEVMVDPTDKTFDFAPSFLQNYAKQAVNFNNTVGKLALLKEQSYLSRNVLNFMEVFKKAKMVDDTHLSLNGEVYDFDPNDKNGSLQRIFNDVTGESKTNIEDRQSKDEYYEDSFENETYQSKSNNSSINEANDLRKSLLNKLENKNTIKYTSKITDIDGFIDALRQLNPNAKIEKVSDLDINSDVPLSNLKLPNGFIPSNNNVKVINFENGVYTSFNINKPEKEKLDPIDVMSINKKLNELDSLIPDKEKDSFINLYNIYVQNQAMANTDKDANEEMHALEKELDKLYDTYTKPVYEVPIESKEEIVENKETSKEESEEKRQEEDKNLQNEFDEIYKECESYINDPGSRIDAKAIQNEIKLYKTASEEEKKNLKEAIYSQINDLRKKKETKKAKHFDPIYVTNMKRAIDNDTTLSKHQEELNEMKNSKDLSEKDKEDMKKLSSDIDNTIQKHKDNALDEALKNDKVYMSHMNEINEMEAQKELNAKEKDDLLKLKQEVLDQRQSYENQINIAENIHASKGKSR